MARHICSRRNGERSVDEYGSNFLYLQHSISLINSLLYFHIVSHLSKKEYFPFSVLNINTWEIFTGNGIIYTGINSVHITLNR